MKISDLNLQFDLGKRIKIINAPENLKYLIGKKGTLTTAFGNYRKNEIGLFLDREIKGQDYINIDNRIKFEWTDELF